MRTTLLFCIIFGSILAAGSAMAQSEKENAKKEVPAAPVVTAPVEEGNIRPSLTLVGSAEPRYTAAVAGEVEGLVQELIARKGDHVAKGDVLARQRTVPLKLRLKQTQAQLSETQARLEKAKADLRRAENLFAQKFTSEEQLQGRRTDLDALKEQIRRLRAAINIVEDNLARMEIRAPFAGTVVAEKTEVGQWLDTGEPVVTLADLSVIHIMVPVPEQKISRIVRNDRVRVKIDALPAREFSGTIAAIVPQADTASRSFPVQVNVENGDGAILSGMLARVIFQPVTLQSALLVPKDALVPQPEGGGYLVKVSDGKAAWIQVRVLETYKDRYAVEALNNDLFAGDRVITRGNERVRPGQEVQDTVSTR
jgi:RND family efflux transporter MFP subunit